MLAALSLLLPRGAAAIVHGPGSIVRYTSPGGVADDMQVDFVWSVLPAAESAVVRASIQFWFENGVGGRAALEGGQANGTHHVIVAIADARVGWHGAGCGRSGGGAHCEIALPMVTKNAYNVKMRFSQRDASGDWWTASVADVKGGGAPVTIGELHLPDADGHRGFGQLTTRAAAIHEYLAPPGCAGLPLSSVGLVGPWWRDATVKPAQAYADFAAGCQYSDASDCIDGAGCGSLRVLMTAGGQTARQHTNTSAPLWLDPQSNAHPALSYA